MLLVNETQRLERARRNLERVNHCSERSTDLHLDALHQRSNATVAAVTVRVTIYVEYMYIYT